jgi:hypothetical protein
MLRWSFLLVLIAGEIQAQVLPKKVTYNTPLMAIVFLSPDCPISQKYMKKLNDLKNEYEGKITFLAAIPAPATKSEIKEFWSEYNSTLAFEHDRDLELVKGLNAKVTPEIFLFDASRSLVYQGAIDNWFYELGKNRREVTEFYFKDAVMASLRGMKPNVQSAEAVGCLIQLPTKSAHHHH